MVLDIDFFRDYRGHDPNKVRENQKKRFKDLNLVETVIDQGKDFILQLNSNNNIKNHFRFNLANM